MPRNREHEEDDVFEFYRRTYGDPPPEIRTIKPVRELWNFQEDIIRHALGLSNLAKPVEEIYTDLEKQGIFVIEAEKSDLLDKDRHGFCRQVKLPDGKQAFQVKVSKWQDLAEHYSIDERSAKSLAWEALGHDAGHAMDKLKLPEISYWGTEARQQMFSQRYGNKTGNMKTLSQGEEFFSGLLRFGSKIKT